MSYFHYGPIVRHAFTLPVIYRRVIMWVFIGHKFRMTNMRNLVKGPFTYYITQKSSILTLPPTPYDVI